MSRPIYEPSLPRADAELGYGSRQLFRRPAPQPRAALPTFRAKQNRSPGDTVLIGVLKELTFDEWENCADDIFEPVVSSGDLVGVRFILEGVYSLYCEAIFADSFNADCPMVLNDGYDASSVVGHRKTTMSAGGLVWAGQRTYPPFHYNTEIVPVGYVAEVYFQVGQNSVANRLLVTDQTFMEIHYEGEGSCVDPTS